MMGTIRQGALGGFSGKAGSMTGSNWKNVNYIKNALIYDVSALAERSTLFAQR